jgi:hypothetical protein
LECPSLNLLSKAMIQGPLPGCPLGERPGSGFTCELLDPCAATLNQDHQNENKKYAGNNPDNCWTVHFSIPFRSSEPTYAMLQQTAELLDPGAAALDQDAQNQNEKHTGNYSDNESAVHGKFPLRLVAKQ